jgi:hypothetical protein
MCVWIDHPLFSPSWVAPIQASPTVGRYCPSQSRSWKIDLSRGSNAAGGSLSDGRGGLAGLRWTLDISYWPAGLVPGASSAGIPQCSRHARDNRSGIRKTSPHNPTRDKTAADTQLQSSPLSPRREWTMATARGKLNVSFVVRLSTSRRHNKNPDRFSDRGFSLSPLQP